MCVPPRMQAVLGSVAATTLAQHSLACVLNSIKPGSLTAAQVTSMALVWTALSCMHEAHNEAAVADGGFGSIS